MAKAVINLQKESGGIVKISPVDGVGITEVTVPESGELVTKEYVDTNIINVINMINFGSTGAYGLKWNQETDIYEKLGATDRTQIQKNMKRCVLKDDGTVNYYLDPYDSTKKADGTDTCSSYRS